MTQKDWQKDPRLKQMDEEKLKYLTELAETAGSMPKDKLLPLLMGLASGNSRMDFSDEETELMVSILTSGMSSAQKKQVETLRRLSRQMGKQASGRNRKNS